MPLALQARLLKILRKNNFVTLVQSLPDSRTVHCIKSTCLWSFSKMSNVLRHSRNSRRWVQSHEPNSHLCNKLQSQWITYQLPRHCPWYHGDHNNQKSPEMCCNWALRCTPSIITEMLIITDADFWNNSICIFPKTTVVVGFSTKPGLIY